MPLVKIDMIRGVRTPEEIKKVADVVQEVMLATFNAPPRDRYQVCFFSSLAFSLFPLLKFRYIGVFKYCLSVLFPSLWWRGIGVLRGLGGTFFFFFF